MSSCRSLIGACRIGRRTDPPISKHTARILDLRYFMGELARKASGRGKLAAKPRFGLVGITDGQ